MATVSVFTKPWKTQGLGYIADRLAELSVQGVELVVRPGFQVEPGPGLEARLSRAATVFSERGPRIFSIASEPDSQAIAACATRRFR